MKSLQLITGLCLVITCYSCGPGKPNLSSTGDTTSTSDAVNRANGAHALGDSIGRRVAGDTTAAGKLNKKDSTKDIILKH